MFKLARTDSGMMEQRNSGGSGPAAAVADANGTRRASNNYSASCQECPAADEVIPSALRRIWYQTGDGDGLQVLGGLGGRRDLE